MAKCVVTQVVFLFQACLPMARYDDSFEEYVDRRLRMQVPSKPGLGE